MRMLLGIDWPPMFDALIVKGAACLASSYAGAVLIARLDARRTAPAPAVATEQV